MISYDPFAAADMFPASAWQSRCNGNGDRCVQVNHGTAGLHALRDTKLSEAPVLVFDDEEYRAFLVAEVKHFLGSRLSDGGPTA